MGNEHCSLSANDAQLRIKQRTSSREVQIETSNENQIDIRTDPEENIQVKNFLDIGFRENKKASKQVDFSIKKQQHSQTKNSKFQKRFSLLDLEECEKQYSIQQTIQNSTKTDSQLFQTTETDHKFTMTSIQSPANFQFQTKNTTRNKSAFATDFSHFKKIKIKHSNFVKVNTKKFEIAYQLLEKIGEGASGNVFKTRCRRTNEIRAVKILKKNFLKKLGKDQKLHTELNILKKLDHPNIIKIFDIFHTDELYYVVIQYCSGGTLKEYIQKSPSISIQFIKIVMKQLLGALTYLHWQSVLHRDIKLENIVFDTNTKNCLVDDLQIKLIDFGLAMEAKFKNINKDTPFAGTPLYMAPQVVKGKYSDKCDVWSCGVIMYYMFSGEFPFRSFQVEEMYRKICQENIDFEKPTFQCISDEVMEILKRMLEKDFLRRTTATQVLNSAWFSEESLQQKKTQKELICKKMREYKKQNNFLRLIESYLIFSKSNNQEQRRFIKLFQRIDMNNNGVIDLNELEQLFNFTSQIEKSQLKILLNKIDKDGSGKIEISQFLAFFYDKEKLFCSQNLREAFDYLDEDKNGFIDKKQLKKALQGCQLSQYQAIIKDMDDNLDEKVSKQEFMDYILRVKEIQVQ